MSLKQSKNIRSLELYHQLCSGKVINKAEAARKYDVDKRSIQRDVDDIRAFLAEQAVDGTDERRIEYRREKKGYIMTGNESSLMENSEILAVSKILLASRAFSRKEMGNILDKLMKGCVPRDNMKLVSDVIANEKYHYVELKQTVPVRELLWELANEIKQHNLIEIVYQKKINSSLEVKRCIQPVAILFSDYYFYLNAYIVEQDPSGAYSRKYSYPAVFRIDRIRSCRQLGEKFKIPYANRFEEGEFRKRVQFMYAGELVKLQFRYSGNSLEAILDRLPTARVLSEDKDGCVIEAEVYGKGVLMWLLSQGDMVEILKPESYRSEMKELLEQMLKKYS